MESKLQKWGNSAGIRIPSAMLKSLNINIDDKLEIIEEDERIVITKSKNNKISLKERFENYKGTNPVKFEWDKPIGKEIW